MHKHYPHNRKKCTGTIFGISHTENNIFIIDLESVSNNTCKQAQKCKWHSFLPWKIINGKDD